MLQQGSGVDCRTSDLLTPLHIAAHCGHCTTATLLLDSKASVNVYALNGFTPLHVACKKNRVKMVALLLSRGADPAIATESGLTARVITIFILDLTTVLIHFCYFFRTRKQRNKNEWDVTKMSDEGSTGGQ